MTLCLVSINWSNGSYHIYLSWKKSSFLVWDEILDALASWGVIRGVISYIYIYIYIFPKHMARELEIFCCLNKIELGLNFLYKFTPMNNQICPNSVAAIDLIIRVYWLQSLLLTSVTKFLFQLCWDVSGCLDISWSFPIYRN